MRFKRCLMILGGTTTLTDCMVAIRYMIEPGKLIGGTEITAYEKTFAQKAGTRYAYSFSSGRVGLYALLKILGVGAGDEVLLQVPTHIVVPNAIRYTGARPVYVDCKLETYNMDMEHAEKLISPRTKVLLLQHTFGIPADIEAALDMAKRYNLIVIEDCVHALGATYNGKPVGSFGKAAFFSTEETKIISTTMGGVVVTDDPELAVKLRVFQSGCSLLSARQIVSYISKLIIYHILGEPLLHRYVRIIYEFFGKRNPLPKATTNDEVRGLKPNNYEKRLSNVQAVIGLRQLRRLEDNVCHRRSIAGIYRERLEDHGFMVPSIPKGAVPSYLRYPVLVKDKEKVMKVLSPYTVTGTWFTSVLEEAVSPAVGEYKMGSCPMAEEATRHLVNLPTHPHVTCQDAETILSVMGREVPPYRS